MGSFTFPWTFVSLLQLSTVCRSEPDYCSTVKQSIPKSGKRLIVFNFLNMTTNPGITCVDHCAMSCLCVSVNKKKLNNGEELCELNFEDKVTATVKLKDHSDYEYFELRQEGVSYKVGVAFYDFQEG